MNEEKSYSDQRYFHTYILIPREPRVTTKWIQNRLKRVCNVDQKGTPFANIKSITGRKWAAPKFMKIIAPKSYAGSNDAVKALEVPGTDSCAYDIFVGEYECKATYAHLAGSEAASFFVVSLGYARLARDIIYRLVEDQDLLDNFLFMKPAMTKLQEICQKPEGKRQTITLNITGIHVVAPGSKKLINGVRLAGSDVLESGLLPKIEEWMSGENSVLERKRDVSKTIDRKSLFRPKSIRISAEMRLLGNGASVTFGAKGACKFWLRKDASNLDPFAETIVRFAKGKAFSASSELPGRFEESEY